MEIEIPMVAEQSRPAQIAVDANMLNPEEKSEAVLESVVKEMEMFEIKSSKGSPSLSYSTSQTSHSSHTFQQKTPMDDIENQSNFENESHSSVSSIVPVGLDRLPFQRMNIVAKSGGIFTLMVVGQAGLGKATFVNTLCSTDIVQTGAEAGKAKASNRKSVSVAFHNAVLYEENFKLKLSVVSFPGFGDLINNSFSWVPLCEYIEEQLRMYHFQEEQPDREKLNDTRVHACIYFISPSNNGLTPLDLISMKELSKRVNLIPVIPKADGYTKEEIMKRKATIRELFKMHDINICQYLSDESLYHSIIQRMPYALIGSSKHYTNAKGDIVRGRKYPWGVSEVENDEHCDFNDIRELLMSEYMLDLISSTESHYENYRAEMLRFRLYQENLLSKGLELSKPELLIKVDQNGSLIKNFTDVDYFPKEDGLVALKKASKISNSTIYQYILESNPIFLHQQYIMKKKFSDIVALQEKKFRDWKKALFDKQTNFNKDIEQIHAKVIKYQESINYLVGAHSGSTYDVTEDYEDGDEDEDDTEEDDNEDTNMIENSENGGDDDDEEVEETVEEDDSENDTRVRDSDEEYVKKVGYRNTNKTLHGAKNALRFKSALAKRNQASIESAEDTNDSGDDEDYYTQGTGNYTIEDSGGLSEGQEPRATIELKNLGTGSSLAVEKPHLETKKHRRRTIK